jgi:hypothetical protein
MTTLAEIETAAAALSDAEKQQLMLFLMAEDEAAMRRIPPSAPRAQG